MKNSFFGKVISLFAVTVLLASLCGCGKSKVDIEVSANKVKLAVGDEETVTIDNYDDLEDVEVEIDDDDIAEISVKNGKITVSGLEEGKTTITVTASNSDSSVSIKVVVEESEEDVTGVGEVVPNEPAEQTLEQIEVDATEMELGLNFLTGTYFHTTILNYDSSWTNLTVSKSRDGVAAAWIDDYDPSHIDISPVGQGVVTLTISADGMKPATIEVAVVKGVGEIGEPDPHWSSSDGCVYGGRLACATTYWDVWTLDGFHLGEGRQSEGSLVFYTDENRWGNYYQYRVNGGLRHDLCVYLGIQDSEVVDRPDTYEEYLELYEEDERLQENFDDTEEGYEEYLELLDEYLEYVSGSEFSDDYFDGFEWELIDTGYYAPDHESPLYFGKRTCPNDPDGDTETYYIYFEYEDTVHGETNYVTVEFDQFTWEGLVQDAKGLYGTEEEAEIEVITDSASRIFNYVAHDRSTWDF